MKKFLLILILLLPLAVIGQEKLTEVKTKRGQVAGYTLNTDILFEVYKDSVVMNYVNKRVVRQLEKKGLPTSVTYSGTCKIEKMGNLSSYVYKTDDWKVTVLPESSSGKSVVKIQTKDDFSGEVTEQLYYD